MLFIQFILDGIDVHALDYVLEVSDVIYFAAHIPMKKSKLSRRKSAIHCYPMSLYKQIIQRQMY